jgi:23S rRNA (uridine2552-2'-O)-methyltransferase
VIGLDLLEIEPLPGAVFLRGDFQEEVVEAELAAALDGRPVDLVLSDMAPNLSGVAVADAARMAHLAELALEFAVGHLKADGALLIKCFHGSGYSQLVQAFKRVFVSGAVRKPKASRDKSAETYLLGRGLKARPSETLPASGSAGQAVGGRADEGVE